MPLTVAFRDAKGKTAALVAPLVMSQGSVPPPVMVQLVVVVFHVSVVVPDQVPVAAMTLVVRDASANAANPRLAWVKMDPSDGTKAFKIRME